MSRLFYSFLFKICWLIWFMHDEWMNVLYIIELISLWKDFFSLHLTKMKFVHRSNKNCNNTSKVCQTAKLFGQFQVFFLNISMQLDMIFHNFFDSQSNKWVKFFKTVVNCSHLLEKKRFINSFRNLDPDDAHPKLHRLTEVSNGWAPSFALCLQTSYV